MKQSFITYIESIIEVAPLTLRFKLQILRLFNFNIELLIDLRLNNTFSI